MAALRESVLDQVLEGNGMSLTFLAVLGIGLGKTTSGTRKGVRLFS